MSDFAQVTEILNVRGQTRALLSDLVSLTQDPKLTWRSGDAEVDKEPCSIDSGFRLRICTDPFPGA